MRTTVDIPDDLYRQAESKAAQEGVAMSELIARMLRRTLGENRVAARRRITFPLHHSARPGELTIEVARAAEEAAAQQEDVARACAL